MAQPDFYHLEISGMNANVHILLNGFPVHEGDNEFDAVASVPVQLNLIGNNNELRVIAQSSINDKPGKLVVGIVPYSKGDISDTGLANEGVLNFEMVLNEEQQDKTYKFDNDGHDYSYIFTEADPLAEQEALVFGEHLYDLLSKGEVDAFVQEMPHRLKDFGKVYGFAEDQMREGMASQLKDMFFTEKYPALKADELSAKPYCDGRVWEVLINSKPFLFKEDETSKVQIPIYIAKIDGRISIVR